MLSSRNRKLKRFSRFLAFFVIVFSGCYYRLQKLYENAKDYTSSDEFMENSPFVPPFIREIHRQKKQIDIRKQVFGVRLPPEDENELRYRLNKSAAENNPLQQQQIKNIVRYKNPYTMALQRQAFFKFQRLRYLFR
ncbi:UNKNOWN [Stylonychia lemnae]|uniref:Uncharacterized protein n=1 Tax=Stylonychia lemnae TaxID=5949 RepID=A0A077ZX48_STYLE|nr:UNKNOWN [Stylonychia lemnae]|eukprot:CDW74151.1 UNKNOWN [Stylonychia lemnae]